MTGSKHNHEGNSGDNGEPEPGPYWRRMHRDWRFWVGCAFYGCGARYLRAEWRPGLGSTRAPATCDACKCGKLNPHLVNVASVRTAKLSNA